MLNKFAQVKEAEVRGVLAAFVDNGLINVQTPQQFDKLASVVSNNLPASYTVDDIANLTLPAMQKVAEDSSDNATQMALGELALMKVAGQVSDAEFDAMAEGILKEAESNTAGEKLDAAIAKAKELSSKGLDKIKPFLKKLPGATDLEYALNGISNLKKNPKGGLWSDSLRNATKLNIAKHLGLATAKAGGTLGATGATIYAGKKLYDKYKGE